MTHLVLSLNNYLINPITFVINSIYEIIVQILQSVEDSKNSKAQYEVARLLHREYQNESFDYVHHLVKQGNLNELVK